MITAVRTILTYIIVSVYVAITGSLGMLIAVVFRWPGVLYIFGHGGVRLACAVSGIRFRVEGQPVLDRAVVYCANHQSNVDPPILFTTLHPRMHILYKHEIDRIPILARSFRMGGFIPIDRRNKESAVRSIETGAQSIRDGNSFLIFPEGTRSKTDELLPFKKGGFVMAIKAQAPIVPVAVQGGREAMKRGSWLVRPVTVTVRIGTPIETAGHTLNDRSALIERVRHDILALLAQGPAHTGAGYGPV
jgi:1-acyl-sn-glycerol-3-phosphate acyltransferase